MAPARKPPKVVVDEPQMRTERSPIDLGEEGEAYWLDKEGKSEGWHNAYNHAFARGCSEKAAWLFADSHGDDENFQS